MNTNKAETAVKRMSRDNSRRQRQAQEEGDSLLGEENTSQKATNGQGKHATPLSKTTNQGSIWLLVNSRDLSNLGSAVK